jgi:hypothetical protein
MTHFFPPPVAALLALGLFPTLAFSQVLEASPPEAVRVNVTLNSDGSRTVYEFDAANHKATATTTDSDGKMRGKIQYQLDDGGRFASGQVFGPDGQFRFNSTYKYDGNGRMQQETQTTKEGAVISKIVYAYNAAGKQTGYSIYDGSGKLIGRTGSSATPASSAKPRRVGH